MVISGKDRILERQQLSVGNCLVNIVTQGTIEAHLTELDANVCLWENKH